MEEAIFNRTKIVATIGPATSSYENLKIIMEEGVDVCRLNSSHGSQEDHMMVINNIKKLNKENSTNICILLDLQGPKLRVGDMENGHAELVKDSLINVTTERCLGSSSRIFVNFPTLPNDVQVGEKILLDDGKLELEVIETDKNTNIKVKVIVGGVLSSKKGFNLPQTNLSIPCLTEKDLSDLEFGIKQKVEWIGLSFVRNADDIKMLREIIEKSEWKPRIVAKIEKPDAVKSIDSIIEATDAVMVARGDLGVELPMEQVPVIQKVIVKKCIEASKPVIIATQMMESMINSPVPTRAELNDIANAVMDGADAVMLSAETSVGSYPVQAIRYMQKTIAEAEQKTNAPYNRGKIPHENSPTFLSDELLYTAVKISDHVNANAIVGMTFSGYSAYKISSFRPKTPIFIFTTNEKLLNTLNLVWGVRGYLYSSFQSTDHSVDEVNIQLREKGHVKKGDIVVNTISMPIAKRQRTNTIKISEIE